MGGAQPGCKVKTKSLCSFACIGCLLWLFSCPCLPFDSIPTTVSSTLSPPHPSTEVAFTRSPAALRVTSDLRISQSSRQLSIFSWPDYSAVSEAMDHPVILTISQLLGFFDSILLCSSFDLSGFSHSGSVLASCALLALQHLSTGPQDTRLCTLCSSFCHSLGFHFHLHAAQSRLPPWASDSYIQKPARPRG